MYFFSIIPSSSVTFRERLDTQDPAEILAEMAAV